MADFMEMMMQGGNPMMDMYNSTIQPYTNPMPAGSGVAADGAVPQEKEGMLEKIMSMGSSGHGDKYQNMALTQTPQAQQMPIQSLMQMIGQGGQQQAPAQGYANPYIRSLMGG